MQSRRIILDCTALTPRKFVATETIFTAESNAQKDLESAARSVVKPFSAQEPVRHQRLIRDLNRIYYV
jgi:hypothetical protein